MSDATKPGAASSDGGRFVVDATACIGCGVSSSVAPDHIRIGPSGKAELHHRPSSDQEVRAVEAAALLCPVGAIGWEGSS